MICDFLKRLFLLIQLENDLKGLKVVKIKVLREKNDLRVANPKTTHHTLRGLGLTK